MELILKEWLGAGGKPINLFDESIIEDNALYYSRIIDVLLGKTPSANLKNFIITTFGLNASEYSENEEKLEIKESRIETLKQLYKVSLARFINDLEKRRSFLSQIKEINDKHFINQRSQESNPICTFIEINGEVLLYTYQYAAEFELLINEGKKVKEYIKIRIEPRNLVGEGNLTKMLHSFFNIQQLDYVSGKESLSFLILYYLAFLGRLQEVIKKGIYREYVDLEDNLHYLKERLLVEDHVRLNFFNKQRLYCGFSELSPNNFINQTILTTLSQIKKQTKDFDLLQHQVRKAQSGFYENEVASTPINVEIIKSLRYNRQNKPYEEIMGYCENILRNIGGSFSSENRLKYASFYVDMNELFENFVGKKLKAFKSANGEDQDIFYDSFKEIWRLILKKEDEVSNCTVEFQNQNHYALDEENVFTIKPDFLIRDRNDKVIAVLDAKYKRLNNRVHENYGISSSDVYQVLSYAYKFNTDKMFLIYPKPSQDIDKVGSFALKIDNLENTKKELYICFIDLLTDPS
jgi:5-methylcytosine-specific restriction endonuclease McrBC regulatory subunit McrC